MKKIIFLIFFMLFHSYAFANKLDNEDVSRWMLFLGRFHPLILHLPIGALIITFYLDIIGRIQKKYPKSTIKYALGFSSFFAILTSVFGYFLSLEGGYETNILDKHYWLGILSAILITILFISSISRLKWAEISFLPLFILTLMSIGIAGHYGSVLTHGEDFITEYAGNPPEQRIIENVDSLRIYNDVVAQIFDDKCTRCHNNTKKKGELSLVSKETIIKGGENGDVVSKNDAEESKIYTSSFLPLEDDNHMPPKGKPQLTKDELKIIKYWIDNDMHFNVKVSEIKKNDTINKLFKKYLVFEENHIPFASLNNINKVRKNGFSLRQVLPDKAGLSVRYLNENWTNKGLNILKGIKEQIIELDLSNSELSDKMTKTLGAFKNLKKLKLDNTSITDESLIYLEGLENLTILNLHNTQITNTGLENLLKHIVPSNIYTWNTQIDDEFAKNIENKYETKISNGIAKGFIEKVALKKPILLTKKTLFEDTISVVLLSKMRNVVLRYTLNGKEPDSISTVYNQPIILESNVEFKAKAFKKDWYASETLRRNFAKIGYEITEYTIDKEPEKRYDGSNKLFDLEEGSLSFKDGKWIGFLGDDLNTTINLGAVKKVDKLAINCLENFGNYILFPSKLILLASNFENSGYKKIGELKIPRGEYVTESLIKRYVLDVPKTEAQYFKVIVKNPKVLPHSHPAAGEKSWIFVDEIMLW